MIAGNPGRRLPPIGFWSYARQDDDASEGRLSALRAQLRSELQTQYGREPIKVFQDVAAIPPGAEWEAEIRNALDRSTFFIPIITPNFVESEWCIREVQIFLEREAALNAQHPELAGRRRIFPVSYVPIDDADPFDLRALAELKRLQWFDFTALRFKDQHDERVRLALSSLASGICRLINIRLETPLTPEEREEQERRRAADEKLRKERDEAKRLADEAEIDRQRQETERETERRRLADLEAARLKAERDEAERRRREEEARKKREEDERRKQEEEARKKQRWRRLLVALGLAKGADGETPRRARLVAGAAAVVVVAALAAPLWNQFGPDAEAKRALATLTDNDWSVQTAAILTAKGLSHTSLAKIQKYAEGGDPKAETFVGLSYYAPAAGVMQDYVEAGSWFHRAADKNNARALYNLGDLYDFGHGVDVDHDKATTWYARAAELGNARAQYELGLNYQNGQGGLTRDDDKAVSWIRKSAAQNYPIAATDLGYMYDNGLGVPQSWTEGANWYRKAAELGDAQGQFSLGYDYAYGQGVPMDKAQAVVWYTKSADQKYASAQYNLGLMYAAGDGVPMNMDKARELISAGAANGSDKAKTWLSNHPVAPSAPPRPSRDCSTERPAAIRPAGSSTR